MGRDGREPGTTPILAENGESSRWRAFGYNATVRIYTRTGDEGDTGLFGGGRVRKDDARVEAYGALDELNALLGTARAHGLPPHLETLAARLQEELFVLGADLATPTDTKARADRVVRIDEDAVRRLEQEIDACEEALEPLTTFILPGGSGGGAALHHARTVCRRAERRIVSLTRGVPVSEHALPYVNRLSDLLFVMARAANAAAGAPEPPWLP